MKSCFSFLLEKTWQDYTTGEGKLKMQHDGKKKTRSRLTS
ncbi:hypothetical protein HMPREF9141_1578 [Prevotella multiformis DSM 16608]|uniref:Uncharacterized protein n=1 Tax=Prevotella multiformis DSM 16608 TaxID=888743 RepID=F0F7L1_9BACT|nr:hypothetical protein HMPREF9141_1578 [Prevotella multiformis DSM 16608]